MERSEVVNRLTTIFRILFNDNSLTLTDETTANDVENWNSLTHMLLITEIENSFSIKFKLKDLNKMHNVSNMIDIILSKL
jgi:acyl carrier protein